MKELLLHVLATFALLLCIGVIAMWVRGCSDNDYLFYCSGVEKQPSGYEISGFATRWANGSVSFAHERLRSLAASSYVPSIPSKGWHYSSIRASAPATPQPTVHQWFGFGWSHTIDEPFSGGLASISELLLPYWFLALVTGGPSFFWFLGIFRKGIRGLRIRPGICPACGYDIRATPNRCPECGTVIGIHSSN